MEVLYITKTSPLSDGGGGEKRAREVTKRLAARGHEVTILCGKTDAGLPTRTRHNGCTIRHVTCIPDALFRFPAFSFFATRYLFALLSIPALVGRLQSDQPDVIVENMTPYPTLTVLFANLMGIPIVAVQHEFYDRSCYKTYGPVTATIQLTVQNFLRIFRYTAIIVPTTYVKAELAAYGVAEHRITVVPNGIEWERYQRDADSDKTTLVTVGRLSKRKGQAEVLRAFAAVRADHADASLEVLGDGPARERLERLADDLGVGDAVTFHGYVDEEEKITRLNRASVFVFGSTQEGFGLVLLEAMAAGVPVVARRLPVYVDFFTDGRNGHLVDEPVVSNLARAVGDLLADESKRDTIGDRNRRDAADYDWNRTAEETAAVVESIETQVRV